jgi:NADPH:quinone reductase-like Zn-dependent oxidoreductase
VVEVNDTASVPTVSTGKILVNVKASGVNPADWKIREGYFEQMAPLQFPSTLGMDFSGIVKQIGEEGEDDMSSDFKEGDEVYGQASVLTGGSGAFAELALANKGSVAHKAVLSYDRMKEYLSSLAKDGLIEYEQGRMTYRTTAKGMHLLKLYNNVNEMVQSSL